MRVGLPILAKTRCSRPGLPNDPARLSAWPARQSRRTTSVHTIASGTGCATSKRPTPTKPSLWRRSRLGSKQQVTAAFRRGSCKPIATKWPSAPVPGPTTCFDPCETPARRAQSFSCTKAVSSSIRRTATCSPCSAVSRHIATGSWASSHARPPTTSSSFAHMASMASRGCPTPTSKSPCASWVTTAPGVGPWPARWAPRPKRKTRNRTFRSARIATC